MTDDQKKTYMEDVIIQGIRRAPEAETPPDLVYRIMDNLEAKKPSFRTRLKLWLLRPQVLTIRPLQVLPVVTFAVALLALAIVKWDTPIGDDAPQWAAVRFVLHDFHQEARNVSVIGSFNNWRPDRSVMWYDTKTQEWIFEAQLPIGDYEYLFMVNGKQLIPDPKAPMSRDDGFGNLNSIIFVNGQHEQAL